VRPSILVLDGEQRAALAVVRSLGQRGCHVHVGSTETRSLAGGSRFADSETLLPDPLRETVAFSVAVADLARGRSAQVVIPVTEASTLAVLEQKDLFTEFHVPTSDLEHFRRATDKEAVLSLARNLGVAVPAQWTTSGEKGREPEIPMEQFPVVIKPARSVAGDQGNRRKTGVRYSSTPDQLRRTLREMGLDAGPFLIQSRVEGYGLGVFLLRWNGKLIASFAHRRIREKPPSGGVSVCCESIPAPEALVAQSASLLEALNWNGVAMIEYKHDVRSGVSHLMEVNPRFWGSLQLAIDAGVDFPWYLAQLALGQQVAPVHQWRVGVRSRWVLGEIDHLIARLRHSGAKLDLPAHAPGVLRTAANVLMPWRPGQRGEVFRFSDPVPACREAISWIRAL
jgi:predicted ATP-grasp superfamily ATP-dependent carboligase